MIYGNIWECAWTQKLRGLLSDPSNWTNTSQVNRGTVVLLHHCDQKVTKRGNVSQIPPPCDVTKCDVTSHFVMLAICLVTRCDMRDVTSLRRHFRKCRLRDITSRMSHLVTWQVGRGGCAFAYRYANAQPPLSCLWRKHPSNDVTSRLSQVWKRDCVNHDKFHKT
jgi:hypothetical protein